jgi:bacterioferritin-associated ferredoxin
VYVCLCKALTEADVAQRSRACIAEGLRDASKMLEVLDLYSDDVCGFCAEHPQDITGIFEDELELYLGNYMSESEVATNT